MTTGGVGPGCELGTADHPARGLIIRVDPSRHPATVSIVRSYEHRPAIDDICCGSFQQQPNGDVLIDWGQTPGMTEFDARGQVRMDLSLSTWSYRGLRFPWVGKPLTRPSVAARSVGAGTEVWASWNGATQVAAWQVLAGRSPSALRLVGASVPDRSFETPIALSGRYASVKVRALDTRGLVLGASRVIEVG